MVEKSGSQVVTPIPEFTRCERIRSQASSVLMEMNTAIKTTSIR